VSLRELDKQAWRRGRGRAATRTAWPTLWVLACDALLLRATVALAQSDRGFLYGCAVLTLVPVLVHFYLVLHECSHNAVFVSPRCNEALGHLMGFFVFCPFLSRRRSHAMHHAWTGHAEHDPTNARAIQRFANMSPQSLSMLEVLWRIWVPFLALGERVGLWLAPFGADRDARGAAAERLATSLYLVGYAILFACLDWFCCWARPLGLYAVCFVLLLMIEELVNLPHHLQSPLTRLRLPSWKQGRVTHSCADVPIWSRWGLLHFNLHEAHHVWPTLPWYELPAAHSELAQCSVATIVSHELAWSIEQRRLSFAVVLREYLEAPAAARATSATRGDDDDHAHGEDAERGADSSASLTMR
jgi:omega-6 fatty acid desaturase (delta-12 desaturase)